MAEQSPLEASLQELHRELELARPNESQSTELLEGLMDDVIHNLVGPADPALDAGPSLRERLEAAIDAIENRHPRLTLAIGSVLDALAPEGM